MNEDVFKTIISILEKHKKPVAIEFRMDSCPYFDYLRITLRTSDKCVQRLIAAEDLFWLTDNSDEIVSSVLNELSEATYEAKEEMN